MATINPPILSAYNYKAAAAVAITTMALSKIPQERIVGSEAEQEWEEWSFHHHRRSHHQHHHSLSDNYIDVRVVHTTAASAEPDVLIVQIIGKPRVGLNKKE